MCVYYELMSTRTDAGGQVIAFYDYEEPELLFTFVFKLKWRMRQTLGYNSRVESIS